MTSGEIAGALGRPDEDGPRREARPRSGEFSGWGYFRGWGVSNYKATLPRNLCAARRIFVWRKSARSAQANATTIAHHGSRETDYQYQSVPIPAAQVTLVTPATPRVICGINSSAVGEFTLPVIETAPSLATT